ncbi:DUF2695 domain-containing protein [Leptospira koniambonensis]|uniref:DUF2695 domain-containing protein n=1 Tax=Leptospira koniambonensis TaxID=2484950 RepID=A0A4R9J340_9LEPT|nr:DUF2695 domain-containing protein [Leptospira koniambonensis]TGL31306.1 DUF2695 domain-containing protein [Leptospira koniambonensis]
MEIQKLKELLISGIMISGQSSLDRRLPAKKSVPIFIDVRRRLKDFLLENPDAVEGWKLLSQAEEALLNYADAISNFEKYLNLKGRDNKDLKKLAQLKESQLELHDLILSPEELKDLSNILNKYILE